MCHQINRLTGYRHYGNQDGVALVVSLVLLLIITVLSISAMRSTNIDTKISINHQFKQMSFQAAESALARLLGPDPGGNLPVATPGDEAANANYFTSTGVTDQPDLSADLDMTFIEQTPPGKYKFSGFGLDMVAFIYRADATGEVDNSNTRTHNRMQVARLRQ
ncbi:MAG: hypothetical protein GY934_24345 [Gammaproteobacteria bacterium]|nr:hypothetical protein [Gammaproteobacteria bacterium]